MSDLYPPTGPDYAELDSLDEALRESKARTGATEARPDLAEAIEHQLDNYACGKQDATLLREDSGHENQERELLRLNFEQFVSVVLPRYGFTISKREDARKFIDEAGKSCSWN